MDKDVTEYTRVAVLNDMCVILFSLPDTTIVDFAGDDDADDASLKSMSAEDADWWFLQKWYAANRSAFCMGYRVPLHDLVKRLPTPEVRMTVAACTLHMPQQRMPYGPWSTWLERVFLRYGIHHSCEPYGIVVSYLTLAIYLSTRTSRFNRITVYMCLAELLDTSFDELCALAMIVRYIMLGVSRTGGHPQMTARGFVFDAKETKRFHNAVTKRFGVN